MHSSEEIQKIFKFSESLENKETLLFNPKNEYFVKCGPGVYSFEHSTIVAINNFEVHEDQYLCSEACAILYEEPCIMCAMALVHSRVQRVYYVHTSEFGAYSYWNLHERSVNYMYRIFQLIKNNP